MNGRSSCSHLSVPLQRVPPCREHRSASETSAWLNVCSQSATALLSARVLFPQLTTGLLLQTCAPPARVLYPTLCLTSSFLGRMKTGEWGSDRTAWVAPSYSSSMCVHERLIKQNKLLFWNLVSHLHLTHQTKSMLQLLLFGLCSLQSQPWTKL